MTPLDRLAQNSLAFWDTPPQAEAHRLHVSENTTYLVTAPCGYRSVLRVHRLGYHSRRAIECELLWLEALAADRVIETPALYLGRDGRAIQENSVAGLDAPRLMVLFRYIAGHAPDKSDDITQNFEILGGIAARCHDHVLRWSKPDNFERPVWDEKNLLGKKPVWGHWRDAPEVTPSVADTLQQVENTLRVRLAAFGQAPERFNLIHADMRLANLLVDARQIRLIDFDDCGWGWFLYDFAAAISFIEDDPCIPAFKAAWLRGYRAVRALDVEEENEMDSFIMLRRMALLAWIGTHQEAPEPQALARGFAAATAALGRAYLKKMSASK